jgi:hypothetical protein
MRQIFQPPFTTSKQSRVTFSKIGADFRLTRRLEGGSMPARTVRAGSAAHPWFPRVVSGATYLDNVNAFNQATTLGGSLAAALRHRLCARPAG